MYQNCLTRPSFRSCIRVCRTCGHARVQPNSSSETQFFYTPSTRALVGLVVKHVINKQWFGEGFTL
ncbi:hypothetical protein Hanom_Chr02g00146421 [Helianthus anomalus]